MNRLKLWQWIVLALPLVIIVGFIMTAASVTIHHWGINWIWAVFTLVLLGWRWLLVRWIKPAVLEIKQITHDVEQALESQQFALPESSETKQAQTVLATLLETTVNDPPLWQNPGIFWQRCQELITEIARIYHPEVKYPLLNIYVSQAYGLLRGTVDDVDKMMSQLGPALDQVTVAQAYQAYEVYQRLSPGARKLWEVWNWAQWLLNPAVALTKQVTQRATSDAQKELLVNLGQILRQAALANLCQKAVELYGGQKLPGAIFGGNKQVEIAGSETLRTILEKTKTEDVVVQQPVRILLVGRTGAGKSSLINTLFGAELAKVDVLPSTDQIATYQWQSPTQERLELWDSPGYEQVEGEKFRTMVLEYAQQADVILLVSPVLDPALAMDQKFLKDLKGSESLPLIMVVTQVDRLRPLREWNPPYDWKTGTREKEVSIRDAIAYRQEVLGEVCREFIPVVTSDSTGGRQSWGIDNLCNSFLTTLDPAKEYRLARFFQDRDAQISACYRIIERYRFQLSTSLGIATLLKSPILQFLSTLLTRSPQLGILLAEKIPVEQLPVVVGKLQIAYELWQVLGNKVKPDLSNEFLTLWPLLLRNSKDAGAEAWAFGHALVEYWSQGLSSTQLEERLDQYLSQYPGR